MFVDFFLHQVSKMPLVDQSGEFDWSTTLFQCCQDPAGAFDSVCCFPCQVSRQYQALEGISNTFHCGTCVISAILSCVPCAFIFHLRKKIRSRFSITQGSTAADLCAVVCCSTCAHCMNQRELTNRGFWPGGSCISVTPPGGIG